MNFSSFIPKEFVEVAFKRVLPVLLINKLLFFALYKVKKNPCVVDVGYTVGHFLAGATYAYSVGNISGIDTRVKLLILGLWTARLGLFLWKTRVATNYIDPRYEDIMKNCPQDSFKREAAVFGQYIFQGFIVLITSSPLYWMFKNQLSWNLSQAKGPHLINYACLFVAVLGIVLEGIADNQLQTYKENRSHYKEGHIFQEGLWVKSRHPNLFFDQMTWISFAVSGIFGFNNILALVGPFALHIVMAKLTVPISEKYMKKSRGDKYLEYLKNTNKFRPF